MAPLQASRTTPDGVGAAGAEGAPHRGLLALGGVPLGRDRVRTRLVPYAAVVTHQLGKIYFDGSSHPLGRWRVPNRS